MNIAFFAVPDLLAPLQLWVRRLMHTGGSSSGMRPRQPARAAMLPATQAAGLPPMARRPARLTALAQPAARVQRPLHSVDAQRPLRVVHVMERGASRASAGRMVISGRMADVCAELDRLAAREATLH